MKKFFLLITLMYFGLGTNAQVPLTLQENLQDTLLSMMNTYHFKGLSVSVSYKNTGIWSSAVGESADGIPLQSNMLIGIGSNTKTFVSCIMLKLADNGQIDLNDTIGTWLPGYANINGSITIRQILNHTSGIYDYTENDDFWNTVLTTNIRRKIWTKQEILQTYIGPPYFAAGKSWNYSNTNYLIAGFIAESITGKSIHELIRDSILIPQSLDHTFFPPYETTTETFAHFWSDFRGDGTLCDLSDSSIRFTYLPIEIYSAADAAGALVSTAEDNVLFWKALMNGKIISTSTLKNKMLQFYPIPVDLAFRGDIGYGLGIMKTKLSIGDTIVSHEGAWLGQQNRNLADTMNNIYITVLSNQDFVDPQPVLEGLYKAVLDYSLVGINENSSLTKMDFTIYPNPADKVLNIEIYNLGRQELEIEIYTVTGEVIYQKQYDNIDSNFVSQLDLSGYAKGIYLVKVMQANTVYVGKVVVR